MGHLTSIAFPILGNWTENLGPRVGTIALLHRGMEPSHIVCAPTHRPSWNWSSMAFRALVKKSSVFNTGKHLVLYLYKIPTSDYSFSIEIDRTPGDI